MAKHLLLSLSVSLLVLFNGCIARQQRQPRYVQPQFGDCQIDRLDALEPTNRVESEGGRIETWDPNHEQLQCAGVAVARVTIEPNGLYLPSYSNAAKLIYIVRGRGYQGMVLPGCPETYQDSESDRSYEYEERRGRSRSRESERYEEGRRISLRYRESQEGQRFRDQHQKIRPFRQGDILAVPAGAAIWCYNDEESPVVAIVLYDTANYANQLDQHPREFFLAGRPDEGFQQEGRRSRYQQQEEHSRRQELERERRRQQQGSNHNIFSGFDEKFLAEAFNVDTETARKLQGQGDNRGNIVRVQGRLGLIRPRRSREEEEGSERGWEERKEREFERERRRGGRWNGLEETICTLRLKENIGDPSSADIFSPRAGRVSTVNSHNLPVLYWLQLSAERGVLHSNAIYTPHWNQNAHCVMYVIRGSARVQVVDNFGQAVFDGEVQQGQLLIVPQNFVVLKKARGQEFEWISFKTNDKAMITPLAGQTSAIRAFPVDVIANAFRISPEEARRLKFNRQETTLLPPSRSSEKRAEA